MSNVVRELLAGLVRARRTMPCIQLWGANTDVGKTLVSLGLVREVLRRGLEVANATGSAASHEESFRALYLKPMQTGYPTDSDERKVLEHNPGLSRPGNGTATLFTYGPPVSPHLCGDRPTDEELLRAVLEAMIDPGGDNARHRRHTVVETFGGPGSPMPSRALQVDALRPLFLPALLVGDAKLGGISTTLSSYEMIKSRGYPVRGVCMMHDARLRNHEVVQRHVDEQVVVLEPPEDDGPLRGAFLDQEGWRTLFDVCFGDKAGAEGEGAVDGKKGRARDRIWWPFTQHAALGEGAVDYIDHRSLGDHIVTDDAVLFDASASWWTQVREVAGMVAMGLGVNERKAPRRPWLAGLARSPHDNHPLTIRALFSTLPVQGMSAELMPGLSAAVGSAIGRYGHVLFPRNVHDPALDLTDAMLSHPSHGGYARAFFSDDGSTAVEVALKMAFRKFLVDRDILYAKEGVERERSRDERLRVGVLGVDGAYHGDTLGTMDAVPPSVFTELQTPWTEARGLFLDDVPCVWMTKDGLQVVQSATARPLEARTVGELFRPGTPGGAARRSAYESTIESQVDEYELRTSSMLGACVIEPVVQGAGGMRLIDPEFHRAMDAVCKVRRFAQTLSPPPHYITHACIHLLTRRPYATATKHPGDRRRGLCGPLAAGGGVGGGRPAGHQARHWVLCEAFDGGNRASLAHAGHGRGLQRLQGRLKSAGAAPWPLVHGPSGGLRRRQLRAEAPTGLSGRRGARWPRRRPRGWSTRRRQFLGRQEG